MSTWLTPEWCNDAVAILGRVDIDDGLSVTVLVQLSGSGSEGDAVSTWTIVGGRLTQCIPGSTEGCAVVLSASNEDGWAMLTGSLAPAVAFMQGRLKVDGAMEPVLALLAASARPACMAALAALAEVTER